MNKITDSKIKAIYWRMLVAIFVLGFAFSASSCNEEDYDSILPMEHEMRCDTLLINDVKCLSYYATRSYSTISSMWFVSQKIGDIYLYTCPVDHPFYFEPTFYFEVASSVQPVENMQMHTKKNFCMYKAPDWIDCYSYKSGTAIVTATTGNTLTVCFTDLVMANSEGDTYTFTGTTTLNIRFE
ncbi:MAG: hypothetical protein MJZ41_10895 [Bacteroidaceae bacterium]|nr:hypothetical protein [Bacteroidaceae bacterium]